MFIRSIEEASFNVEVLSDMIYQNYWRSNWMGYTFKSLCIRNFKYITNNKPLKFDFMNSNIVILDGQNGYGKTTLFDAIEVLVTGKIKHFNPSLQNRKTETLGTLANDVNKDIVISAILSSDFQMKYM